MIIGLGLYQNAFYSITDSTVTKYFVKLLEHGSIFAIGVSTDS